MAIDFFWFFVVSLQLIWFHEYVPHMAAMKTFAISGWLGRVKQTGFLAKVGGVLVTSLTSRHVLGLSSRPTAGSANVTIGRGMYSYMSVVMGKFVTSGVMKSTCGTIW